MPSANQVKFDSSLGATGSAPAPPTTHRSRNRPTTLQRDEKLQIKLEHLQFVFLLMVVIVVRASNLNYNTLFVDEAIYATVGQEALDGQFVQNARSWMFGSYLYPVAAAVADRVGGAIGLRLFSVALSTVATIFVFLTAQRLFNRQTALWTMFIFGLSGASISLGQQAVYDAMGLPFLAMAVYFCVQTVYHLDDPTRSKIYAVAASVTMCVSILAKYIGLAYVPMLVLLVGVLYLARGGNLRSILHETPWQYFVWPLVFIVGGYMVMFYSDLRDIFSASRSTQFASRANILSDIWQDAGPIFVVAFFGLLLTYQSPIFKIEVRSRRTLILFLLLVPVVFAGILTLPIYHWVMSNIRALPKHLVYALVFAAPLAGYVAYWLIERLRNVGGRWETHFRLAGVFATVVLLTLFMTQSMDRNWGFQHGWPPTNEVVDFLREAGINEDSRILASGSQIYEYYFNFGMKDCQVWSNTWSMEYKALFGLDAMQTAIRDCALDFIVLDGYYTPDVNAILQPVIATSEYTLAFDTVDQISSGDIIHTQVFVPSDAEICTQTEEEAA